jgi:hypothetical protein
MARSRLESAGLAVTKAVVPGVTVRDGQAQLRHDDHFANIPHDLRPRSLPSSLPCRRNPNASLDSLPSFDFRVGEWFG